MDLEEKSGPSGAGRGRSRRAPHRRYSYHGIIPKSSHRRGRPADPHRADARAAGHRPRPPRRPWQRGLGHVFALRRAGPVDEHGLLGAGGPREPVGLPQRSPSTWAPTPTSTTMKYGLGAPAPAEVPGPGARRTTGRVLPVLAVPTPSSRPAVSLPAHRMLTSGRRGHVSRGRRKGARPCMADASVQQAVIAEGELDAASYGSLLQRVAMVGVRGAGDSHDGLYQVRRSGTSSAGPLTPTFPLARSGTGDGPC